MARKTYNRYISKPPPFVLGRFERTISYPGELHSLVAEWYIGQEITIDDTTGEIVSNWPVTLNLSAQGATPERCEELVKKMFDTATTKHWGQEHDD